MPWYHVKYAYKVWSSLKCILGHFGGLISIAYVVKRLNPLINGLYLGLKTIEFLGEFKFSTLRRIVWGQEKIAVISLWWSQMKGHLQISVQEVKYMLLAVSNLGHLTTFARVTLELNKPKSCLLDVFYLRLNDDISPLVPRPVVTLSK